MYDILIFFYLSMIITAFIAGRYLLIRWKGTSTHKFLGKAYMVVMLLSASLTLFIPAKVGQ
jgi:uncharacterized membrane protein